VSKSNWQWQWCSYAAPRKSRPLQGRLPAAWGGEQKEERSRCTALHSSNILNVGLPPSERLHLYDDDDDGDDANDNDDDDDDDDYDDDDDNDDDDDDDDDFALQNTGLTVVDGTVERTLRAAVQCVQQAGPIPLPNDVRTWRDHPWTMLNLHIQPKRHGPI
jgi:hypothetical protein